MKFELRVLSGTRTGQREVFDKSIVAVGRHPLCDMRFDPDGDRDVSARHAEVRVVEGQAAVFDTNSTNGTFVNGARVEGSRTLHHGDVISFGEMGPKVEFRQVSTADAATAAPPAGPGAGVRPATKAPASGKVGPTARPAPKEVKPRRRTDERIAAAVTEQTRRLRRVFAVIAGILAVSVGASLAVVWKQSQDKKALIEQLIQRNDSLTAAYDATVSAMEGRLTGLDSAYAQARDQTAGLQHQLEQARSGTGTVNVDLVQQRLARAQSKQAAIAGAAQLDARAISRANTPAVALIIVKMPDGSAFSGTAFCITPQGLLVTNRHIVEDDQGRPAVKMQALFSDTRQWIPAHVVKTSTTDDLAFVQLDGDGGASYPVVAGVAPGGQAPAVGSPIAVIGFPLGVETAGNGGDIRNMTARSTLGVGYVSKMLADTMQVDAFASEGSSGSPVFDERGQVVGVIFGGAAEGAGRIVYAVPGAKLLSQRP